MRVDHGAHVGPRAMDRAVDHVAGLVDVIVGVRLPDDVAVEVDLGEAGSGDFLVEQAVQIDQDVVIGPGNARRDVVVREIRHPVAVDQAVAGGQLHARSPLIRRDFVPDAAKVGAVVR